VFASVGVDERQHMQRERAQLDFSDAFGNRQCFQEHRFGGWPVALGPLHHPQTGESPASGSRGRIGRSFQPHLQPGSPFVQQSAMMPERCRVARDIEDSLVVVHCGAAAEGGKEIGVLRIDIPKMRDERLVAVEAVRIEPFAVRGVPRCMRAVRLFEFSMLPQQLDPKFAHDLEHRIAIVIPGAGRTMEQVAGDESADRFDEGLPVPRGGISGISVVEQGFGGV